MIAALFVQTGGAYFGLPDVDPWDEPRDARLYASDKRAIRKPHGQSDAVDDDAEVMP